MPVYVYETILPDNRGGERFEMIQSMNEPALTAHPLTGEPVRRVIQPPNIASKYTPGQTRARLDNKNVEKAGFTKYERDKVTGRYHKVAGKQGPSTLNPS
ncbi:MAG: hypothetical protein JJT96_08285 [Opitutales bacterium]|nr:hypothetical protein [Opitutales bacterium]